MKPGIVIIVLSAMIIILLTGCNQKSDSSANTGSDAGTDTLQTVDESIDPAAISSDTGKSEGDIPSDSIQKDWDTWNDSGESAYDESAYDEITYDESAYDDIYVAGFYGVWVSGVKDRDVAISDAKKLNEAGFDSYVCFSPEWEDMNQDEYYCVTSGRYTTKEAAEDELETVKKEGYSDAYIKFTGAHKYTMVDYTNFGDLEMEINEDNVILKEVRYSLSRAWYADMEAEYISDLVIDKQSVFDEKCEMQFFGNYNEGDEPLEWVKTNYDLMINESDLYISNGPALSGVFEVGITGDHIDRYFGSYWWD